MSCESRHLGLWTPFHPSSMPPCSSILLWESAASGLYRAQPARNLELGVQCQIVAAFVLAAHSASHIESSLRAALVVLSFSAATAHLTTHPPSLLPTHPSCIVSKQRFVKHLLQKTNFHFPLCLCSVAMCASSELPFPDLAICHAPTLPSSTTQ